MGVHYNVFFGHDIQRHRKSCYFKLKQCLVHLLNLRQALNIYHQCPISKGLEIRVVWSSTFPNCWHTLGRALSLQMPLYIPLARGEPFFMIILFVFSVVLFIK